MILPDMFYVKHQFKNKFLNEKVDEANLEMSGEYLWSKYPKFLRYRVCDYSGESINDDDIVYCVFVKKLK